MSYVEKLAAHLGYGRVVANEHGDVLQLDEGNAGQLLYELTDQDPDTYETKEATNG